MFKQRQLSALSACALAAVLAGCAAVGSGQPGAGPSSSTPAVAPPFSQTASGAAPEAPSETEFCQNFFDALERRVQSRSVVDNGQQRLADFPFLRVDRFLASFGHEFKRQLAQSSRGKKAARSELRNSPAFAAWLEQMRTLDARARRHELARMPESAFPIYHHQDRAQAIGDVERCGSLLTEALPADAVPTLLTEADVPDEYSALLRAVGLYPITGIGVASSVRNWEAHQKGVFQQQRGRATFSGRAAFQRYRPSDILPGDVARRQARDLLAAAPRDALGIPSFTDEQRQILFAAFAPVYDIATINDSDRIGRLQWIDLRGLVRPQEDHFWLDVDTGAPVVYTRLDFTRFDGQILPQLVYTIWFSDRPQERNGDLQSGRLDGLVWRVTLDHDGRPLIYDSIQPSGRFAMFFPSRRLVFDKDARAKEEPLTEWAYSPLDRSIEDWVGMQHPGSLALRISSRTHQLVGIAQPDSEWGSPSIDNPPYRLLPDDGLRALPKPDGGARSIYDRNGTVPGSERRSRWLLWSMGLSGAGTIRQPGRQPTALIGRRHFDDAFLFEKRYRRVGE
ncbi:MAG: hypothetical protein Q4A16_03785 [Lautropia sp.]|nr:hypothetical protein [Lautropia sp.]